jgi:hypothetical protein
MASATLLRIARRAICHRAVRCSYLVFPRPCHFPHRPVNGLDRLDQVRKGLIHRWQLRKPRRNHRPRHGLRIALLIKQAKKLPKELYKSLTWDRGKELTDHRRFTLATKIDDPVRSEQRQQRSANESWHQGRRKLLLYYYNKKGGR